MNAFDIEDEMSRRRARPSRSAPRQRKSPQRRAPARRQRAARRRATPMAGRRRVQRNEDDTMAYENERTTRQKNRSDRGYTMRSPSYQDGAEPLPGRGRIPIVLRVSSQKGGVGKTTISVNLAARLSMMGYTVLLIDGDTVNPAISFLLGVNEIDHSVREVLQGRIDIRSAMRKHDSTGMYVVLGDPADTSFLPTSVQLRNFIGQIRLVRDFDFVIIDTPPGFTGSPIESIYEEALVVTLPSTASCASAIRLSEFYDENEVRHELVINRVRNTSSELSVKEVESAVGTEAISVLPEDKIISRSEDMHMPAVIWDRGSKFSKSLTRLAAVYATKRGTPERPPVKESGFFRKLFWSR